MRKRKHTDKDTIPISDIQSDESGHTLSEAQRKADKDANRDPITDEPGSHPVGTGIGTAGGAATGAAIGAVGGPVGAAIGLVAGGIAGAVAGHNVAEKVNPTEEDEYWRHRYRERPYLEEDKDYETYRPAYQYGWESYGKYGTTGRSFDEAETDLSRDWDTYRGQCELDWDSARPAARDAWDRVHTRYTQEDTNRS